MPFRCEVLQAVGEVGLQQKKLVSTFLASAPGGLHDENEEEQLRLQGWG